jgi:hypothetical protein
MLPSSESVVRPMYERQKDYFKSVGTGHRRDFLDTHLVDQKVELCFVDGCQRISAPKTWASFKEHELATVGSIPHKTDSYWREQALVTAKK